MKKIGKYERKPKTGDLLLQTYITSMLSLILCVSMFFGTSYAWFTSEVTNTQNEIYVGTLKVGLYKVVDGQPVNLATSESNTAKLFSNAIRWEPGYTALETIQIVNEGDLAFKYVMNFTDGSGIKGDTALTAEELAAVADMFEVYVFNHYNNKYSTPSSYDALVSNPNWKHVGSLKQVLDGEVVLASVMETVRDIDEKTPANSGTTDGVGTVDTFTIALHMNEDATSDAMGKKIMLNVKLVAYQKAEEVDGFGNHAYDNINIASDLDQLKNALTTDGDVVLTSNIAITNESDRLTMAGGVLDGDGKVVTYTGDKGSSEYSVGVVTTSGGTVRNITINGGEHGRALYSTKLTSDLMVNNCTLSGAYAFNLNSADKTDYKMTFIKTTFENWTSYANAMEHAYFTGCTFKAVLKPYGDTTLTSCTFATESLDVSALEIGESIELINCTYGGNTIANMKLTKNADGITIDSEGNDAKVVDDMLDVSIGGN